MDRRRETVPDLQACACSKADLFVLAPQLLDEFCMDSGWRLMRLSVRTCLGGRQCATQ